MFSEFLFELLRGVGPVDGFGSLVVIGDVVGESGFKNCRRDEMVGLQAFAVDRCPRSDHRRWRVRQTDGGHRGADTALRATSAYLGELDEAAGRLHGLGWRFSHRD